MKNKRQGRGAAQGFYRSIGIGREDCCDAMAIASDSFLIRSDGMASVIAGYHWFGNWHGTRCSRFPPLLSPEGRNCARHARDYSLPHARKAWSPLVSEQACPHTTAGAPRSGSYSVQGYIDATGDMAFSIKPLAQMQEVVSCYVSWTGHLDRPDSLLKLNRPGLTWMTRSSPRANGQPVE